MASSRLRRQRRRTSTSLPSAAGSDAKGAASAMSSAYVNSIHHWWCWPSNPPKKKHLQIFRIKWWISCWSFCWWEINLSRNFKCFQSCFWTSKLGVKMGEPKTYQKTNTRYRVITTFTVRIADASKRVSRIKRRTVALVSNLPVACDSVGAPKPWHLEKVWTNTKRVYMKWQKWMRSINVSETCCEKSMYTTI